MGYADLEEAREQVAVAQDLLADRLGGHDDPVLLGTLELLLGSAARSLADSLFCQRLAELRTYAQALFSESAHLSWGRAPLSGTEYLRLQLLKALNALNARLLTIEAARSHHAAAASRPALRAGHSLSA
jgi:hypothetical protein